MPEEEEQKKIPTMRDAKFSVEDKKKLLIVGGAIFFALAAAVLLYDSIFASSQLLYYPGNCGKNQSSYSGIYSCVSSFANKTQNSTVCLYLPSSIQPGCFYRVALSSQNVSKCGYISSSNPYFSQCIINLNKKYNSMKLCGYLQQSLALQCIYNISAKFNFTGLTLCSQLNGSYSSACSALYYYKNAQQSQNRLLCAYLQNKANATILSFINYNASEVQNYTGSLESMFFYTELNLTPQSYCYYKLALEEDNTSLCNYIIGSFANDCPYDVEETSAASTHFNLNATNVTAACSQYNNYTKAYCYYKYSTYKALEIRNATPCFAINQSAAQGECILALAINTTNFTYCSQISNASIRGVCDLSSNATIKS